MRISKDGAFIITLFSVVTLVITIAYFLSFLNWHPLFIVIVWALFLFCLLFFRDPNRITLAKPDEIISPADGRVIEITSEFEDIIHKSNAIRVSIFLSLFDVHINRIPISGTITYFNYIKGRFYPAFREKASVANEQTVIGISHNNNKVLLKQIAGVVARRITCHIREGYTVEMGQRFGMIRFGSRVDLLLPENSELYIRKNDKVIGGETVIGRFNQSK